MDKNTIDAIKELLAIQGAKGNWDYSEYMLGMYNGIELALSIAENRDPVYREQPTQWRKDETDARKPVSEHR